jgi:hypothetical protein
LTRLLGAYWPKMLAGTMVGKPIAAAVPAVVFKKLRREILRVCFITGSVFVCRSCLNPILCLTRIYFPPGCPVKVQNQRDPRSSRRPGTRRFAPAKEPGENRRADGIDNNRFLCVTGSNVMGRNGKRRNERAEFTALELSVFSVLKGNGNATAGQIRSELPWSSEAKGVRAALLRLEECGLLTHSITSGQIFYHSAAPRESVDAEVLQPADQSGGEPESL